MACRGPKLVLVFKTISIFNLKEEKTALTLLVPNDDLRIFFFQKAVLENNYIFVECKSDFFFF